MQPSTRTPALISAAILLPALLFASPAAAADVSAGTLEEVQAALADCTTAPNTITLSADITAADATLSVDCDTVLDLGTHDLSVRNIIIEPGVEFEVTGPTDGSEGTLTVDAEDQASIAAIATTGATLRVTGGVIVATSGFHGSAIGGASNDDAGTLIVEDGTVRAVGTAVYAAAVGGGYSEGDGGVVAVSGGTLTAINEKVYGVAIGGAGAGLGDGGDGGTLTVTGGVVTATTTGLGSTAIGGGIGGVGDFDEVAGPGGRGTSITIGSGGEVVASSPRTAIGGGHASGRGQEGEFGDVLVEGTLRLPTGGLLIGNGVVVPEVDAEIVIGPTGRILGGEADPTQGATIGGDGSLRNAGSIALSPPADMVTGNNRLITFDTEDDPVRVFAPSLADGHRSLPTPPAGTAWNTTPDGTGEWFDSGSDTSGDGSTELFAVPPGSLSVSTAPSDLTATAGTPFSFPVTVLDAEGEPLDPQPEIDHSSSDCEITDGDVFEAAGGCTIVASTVVAGVALEETFAIEVVAGAPSALALTPSATEVDEGDSVTFEVTGEDAFGNPVDTSGAVLTSSVETDVVSGTTVSFPSASPHTITATLGEATANVVIEVIPAPSVAPEETPAPDDGRLATTGADPTLLWTLGGIAALLLVGGGVLLIIRRRANR